MSDPKGTDEQLERLSDDCTLNDVRVFNHYPIPSSFEVYPVAHIPGNTSKRARVLHVVGITGKYYFFVQSGTEEEIDWSNKTFAKL